MKNATFRTTVWTILCLIIMLALSCKPARPPEALIPPFPEKPPVVVAVWDSLRIDHICLDIQEDLGFKDWQGIKKIDTLKSGIQDLVEFKLTRMGLRIVDQETPHECVLVIRFNGIALPWGDRFFLGGTGHLSMKLLSDGRNPIEYSASVNDPVPGERVLSRHPETFASARNPANYRFGLLWAKEISGFLTDVFGRDMAIYTAAYEIYSSGRMSISAVPFSNTSIHFQEMLSLIKDEEPKIREWAIENLNRSFPDKMNDEVVPHLPELARSDPDRSVRFRALDIMSRYRFSQKYIVMPALIECLDSDDAPFRKKVHEILIQSSSRDFGEDMGKWMTWWRRNHTRIRERKS
ncbi:HEAT repeat domain-containing protein [bacterium]|nr:HEAT repeat domain-containing protein [bacterium]